MQPSPPKAFYPLQYVISHLNHLNCSSLRLCDITVAAFSNKGKAYLDKAIWELLSFSFLCRMEQKLDVYQNNVLTVMYDRLNYNTRNIAEYCTSQFARSGFWNWLSLQDCDVSEKVESLLTQKITQMWIGVHFRLIKYLKLTYFVLEFSVLRKHVDECKNLVRSDIKFTHQSKGKVQHSECLRQYVWVHITFGCYWILLILVLVKIYDISFMFVVFLNKPKYSPRYTWSHNTLLNDTIPHSTFRTQVWAEIDEANSFKNIKLWLEGQHTENCQFGLNNIPTVFDCVHLTSVSRNTTKATIFEVERSIKFP